MDIEMNTLAEYLVSEAALDPKAWKEVKEKVQGKADIVRTVGTLPDGGGNSTTLLQYVKDLSYPQHRFAGILLLHQQANCLPDKPGIRSTFLSELNRLITSLGNEESVSAAAEIASSSSSSDNGSSGNGKGKGEEEEKKNKKPETPTVPNPWLFLSKEVTQCLEKAVSVLCDVMKQPGQGIEMLLEGTKLLRPREGCLTSADSMLLRLCVEAQDFDYAEAYLDSQLIFEIDPKESFLDPIHYLAFFSNGGIIYMAKRQNAKALEYFESAITMPSKVCSEISLSAFKKASLLSLVHTGKAYSCPEHTDSAVKGKTRKQAKDYAKVNEFFAKSDRMGLAKYLVKEDVRKHFEDDGNYGLALHVLSVLQDKAMSDLTSTYIRLSIQDIAEKIGSQSVDHARQDLEKLIASGRIQGSIDTSTGMVTFGSGQGETAAEVDLPDLLERVQETVQLSHKLREMKLEALTSMEYVKSTTTSSSSRIPGLGMATYSVGAGEFDFEGGDVDIDEMDVDHEMDD